MFNKPFSRMQNAKTKTGRLRLGFSIFCALLAMGSAGVLAQEPAASLDQLKLLLEKGDKMTLVDSSGKSTTGRIERMAADAIDVRVEGTIRTFAEKDIRQIDRTKPDSPWNGILIGAAVGFGGTLPLNLAAAGRDEKDLAVAASALWGLIGGGIGAVIDACVHQKQMVYFRPKTNISWSVRPFYSKIPAQLQKSRADAFPPVSQRYTGFDTSKGLALTVRF
jgi:hypothetical protein